MDTHAYRAYASNPTVYPVPLYHVGRIGQSKDTNTYLAYTSNPTVYPVPLYHENSVDLSSTTNPNPRGNHPTACSGKPNLSQRQSQILGAYSLEDSPLDTHRVAGYSFFGGGGGGGGGCSLIWA